MLAERPLDRAGLLRELAARGHPGLGQRSINVLMPWAAAQGLVAGLPDGRYRAAQPPAAVDPDLALATLAAGTWGLTGQGSRRTVTIRWFRRPAASAELRAEQVGVQSFLGCRVRPALTGQFRRTSCRPHEHGARAAASAVWSTRRSRRSP